MSNANASTDERVAKARDVRGTYYVSTSTIETWDVGERYDVRKVLGEGSFGAVALARDGARASDVAMKRIANALASEDVARRVLREIVALHRMRHPNVITLRDVFTRPSAKGAMKLDVRAMTLRAVSVDVYLSFEYAEGGDVHDLRGQLSANEVRGLMQQAAEGARYVHSVGLMHRDIKSANTLLGKHRFGGRVIKLCDFGSARGAIGDVVAVGDCDGMDSEGGSKRRRQHSRSTSSRERSMLTSNVMTPCYRAPEIIMGCVGYTTAVDVWALGCIFAELLQRQVSSGGVGVALNPKLAVQPLFQFDDTALKSPRTGECFGDDAHDETAEERKAQLGKLFDVIGTPTWGEIDRIKSVRWRNYLRSIPGRAGTLDSRFQSGVDATARDLLKRMLRFDPSTRATCEEILAHEYFKDSKLGVDMSANVLSEATLHSVQAMTVNGRDSKAEFWEIDHPGLALEALEKAFSRAHEEARDKGEDAWRDAYRFMFEKECARRERLPDIDDSSEIDAQDRSLALLFPDFFRGDGAVEYKEDERNDVSLHLVDEPLIRQYVSGKGTGWEDHLNRDRMGEWTQQDWDSLRLEKLKASPFGVWGVSSVPPGASKEQGAKEALSDQQSR